VEDEVAWRGDKKNTDR